MARNVGSIEVTVEANTGKLRAQIVPAVKRIGDEAGEALQRGISDGLSDVDTRRLRANLKTQITILSKELERILEGIDPEINFDTTAAHAEIARLKGQLAALEDETITIEIDPDIAKFREAMFDALAEVEATKLQAERDRWEFTAELDTIFAEADARRLQESLERDAINLRVEAEIEQAALALFGFKERTEADHIQMKVETDLLMAQIAADRALLEEIMGELEVEVVPDVQTTKWYAARAQLTAWAEAAGGEGGQRYGRSFASSLGNQGTWIAGGIVALGDALGPAVSGLAGAATAVLASGFQAIGGAAGAAAPLVAGFGTALGSVIVGSRGMGDALGAINEEFATATAEGRSLSLQAEAVASALLNLSPAAASTARAFAGIRKELANSRLGVQEELFRGMSQAVRDLGEGALPSVTAGLKTAAREVNAFGRDLATIADNTDFSGLADALAPALNAAFDAAATLVRTLAPFLTAAAPAAARLADGLKRGADAMEQFVTANPARLESFLNDGVTSLDRWMELLQSTGDLLATIFKAGSDTGDSFVVSLNNIIERWDHFLESTRGQAALADFFETAMDVMKAMQPILDGLKEAFAVMVTPDAISNLESLSQAIGDVLPVLAQVLGILGDLQLGEAIGELVNAFQPFISLIASLPDGVLEFVGTLLVIGKTMSAMSGLVQGGVRALRSFAQASAFAQRANLALLAATVAISAGFAIYDALTGSERKAEEQTKALTVSLGNQVDAMISAGDATSSATAGMEAFNRTLAEGADESGVKLQKALGVVGLGIDDMTSTLVAVRSNAIPALADLAEGFGLPAEEAQKLAEIVASTDDNFDGGSAAMAPYIGRLEEIAEASGITYPTLIRLAQAMEEIQDQGENTNIEAMAQAEIDLARGGTEAEKALLAQAEANQAAGDVAQGVVPLFQEYVRLLFEQENATTGATAATDAMGNALTDVSSRLSSAVGSFDAYNKGLKDAQREAYNAWQEELRLASATEDAASAMAVAMGMPKELADGLIDMGNAADDAATKADALTSALDILFGRSMDAGQAFDDFHTFLNDTTESLNQLDEETGQLADDALPRLTAGLTEAFSGTTPAALGFRDVMREGVQGLFDYAEAATRTGTPSAEVAANFSNMRLQLIALGSQFGISVEESDAFIQSLLGAPGLVETVISTPGLIDALLNASDLTLLYDSITGEPVIAEFLTLGLDPALATSAEFKLLLEQLGLITATPTVEAPTIPPVQGEVETVQGAVDALGASTASPVVTIPNFALVMSQLTVMTIAVGTLNAASANPKVAIPGYATFMAQAIGMLLAMVSLNASSASPRVTVVGTDSALTQVNNLKTAIDRLADKTVTITTRNVTINTTVPGPGGMAGRLINGPTIMPVGELGYREALIPLQLPLNRVDPSVREMAAVLRGQGGMVPVAATPGKTVNNYLTITPMSANPESVATSIINRAAALATR